MTRLVDVTKEMTPLLYALFIDLSIDVGQVIRASVQGTAICSTIGGLEHSTIFDQ